MILYSQVFNKQTLRSSVRYFDDTASMRLNLTVQKL